MTKDIKKEDVKLIIEKGGLLCRAICEILGAPKEHIEETMNLLVKKAFDMKDAYVIKYKIFPAEKQEQLFATFTEMEVLFEKKSALIDFCFNFMPSSVEILEPAKLVVDANILTTWINDLQGRLHAVDKVAKEANAYKTVLNRRVASIIRYNCLSHLKKGVMSKNELRELVGIDESSFEFYLKSLIDRKEIIEENGKLKLGEVVKFQYAEATG